MTYTFRFSHYQYSRINTADCISSNLLREHGILLVTEKLYLLREQIECRFANISREREALRAELKFNLPSVGTRIFSESGARGRVRHDVTRRDYYLGSRNNG